MVFDCIPELCEHQSDHLLRVMDTASRPYVLDTGAEAGKYCTASDYVKLQNGASIAYKLYRISQQKDLQVGAGVETTNKTVYDDKIVMIMGFAAAGAAWLPTLLELFTRGDKASDLEVVVFDNRGIGASSCPGAKEHYSTDIMAGDVLGLMDHLGWSRVHLVGHSMGGMIASRVALAAPDRVASLMLVSVTGGGTEAIPLHPRALWTALRGAFNRSQPEDRARMDLAFHFTEQLLETRDPVTGCTVGELLVEEYVSTSKTVGPQPKAGEEGHLHAVMKHSVSSGERRKLAEAGFPIKVLHGRHDIIAGPRHAERLAAHLRAPLVCTEGAHFITRDCAPQLVDELLATISAVRQGATHADAVHVSVSEVPRGLLGSCFGCCF